MEATARDRTIARKRPHKRPPVVAALSRHHGPRLGAEAAQRQRSRPDGDGVAAGRDQAPGRGNGCATVRDGNVATGSSYAFLASLLTAAMVIASPAG
jgi:hypothetical protein